MPPMTARTKARMVIHNVTQSEPISEAKFTMKLAHMALGAGSTKEGTPFTRTRTSQRTRKPMPTSVGTRKRRRRDVSITHPPLHEGRRKFPHSAPHSHATHGRSGHADKIGRAHV